MMALAIESLFEARAMVALRMAAAVLRLVRLKWWIHVPGHQRDRRCRPV